MRIKELREERTLTQSDVATGIKTSQRNIGRWEREEVLPSSDFIIKLSDFFGVSADYLLGRSDDFGNVIVQSGNAFAPSALPAKEEEILRNFRKLSPALQDAAINTVRALAGAPSEEGLQKKA